MDGALRNWERALRGGDEQARLPLASAYQRLGQVEEALRILGEASEPDGPTQALLRETWRGELSRLAPAQRIPGARPYGELWGWAGEAAVLTSHERASGLLGVVDWARGRFAYEAPPTGPVLQPPAAAGPDELLIPGEPGLLERLDLETGRIRSQRVGAGGQIMEFDSTRSRALLRYVEPGRRLVLSVLRLEDGAEEFQRSGGPKLRVVPNWDQGWIAWRDSGGPLEWGWLPTPDPQRVDPAGALAGREGHLTPLAAMGRFLLAREARGGLLCDPRSGERLELRELPGSAHGPWRLSLDRQALLGFRLGVPAAFPIHGATSPGAPAQALTLPGGPGLSRASWHPHVDVVALGRRDAGAELRSLEGEVWLHLPRDAQPLGWGPQGRSLVVVRALGSLGGLLELWTPGGTL